MSADNAEQAELYKRKSGRFRYPMLYARFKTVGKKFTVIDDESVGVIVRYDDECGKRIEEAAKHLSRAALKNLQVYTVNLRKYRLDQLIEAGLVQNVPNTELFEYVGAYDETGLTGQPATTENDDILCL